MQNIQAIEMQNTVTLSNYTFNIVNNIITVFPVPGTGFGGDGLDGSGDLGYGHYVAQTTIGAGSGLPAGL